MIGVRLTGWKPRCEPQIPKQHASGGRARLGSISKQGDRYLRSLFVARAFAVIRYAKLHGTKYRPWVAALLARRPTKVAAIALANKLALMAWAMMATGERYNYPAALRVLMGKDGLTALMTKAVAAATKRSRELAG
jgi:Transposase IS116/IS110/IS902 family